MIDILEDLRGGLAVSCQAAEDSPLHRTRHIVALARAVVVGGAKALRIESAANVAAVREAVSVPVIGITKIAQPDSEIYVTSSLSDVRELCDAGADILAFDETKRPRPFSVPKRIAVIDRTGRIAIAHQHLPGGYRGDGRRCGLRWNNPFRIHAQLAARRDTRLRSNARTFIGADPIRVRRADRGPSEARLAVEYGAMFVVVGSAINHHPDVITRRFADAVAGVAA
jgi:N-acylglucosamine-6-phosphate 2-epimerase